MTITAQGGEDATVHRTSRTALYLDFDNVYSGLCRADRDVARRFAYDPGLLLNWLASGQDETGNFRRRFLVRDCYLNPQEYAWCRPQFVAAGFRVIDCPSLTQQGKSSADTHIVLDVVAALNHTTHYDEFIICSADADFSPLMTKLRRHDRRTVMIAAGPFATAYEAVCDTAIGPLQLVEALTPNPLSAGQAKDSQPQAATSPTIPAVDLEAAMNAVREAVANAPAPIPGSSAAAAALKAVPNIAAAGWGGTGSFAAFIEHGLPELDLVRAQSGGWLLDPKRHSAADIPVPSGAADDIVARVCRIVRSQRFTSDQYAIMFLELVRASKTQPAIGRLAADVRDGAASRGVPLGRSAVNVIVSGLVYSGFNFRAENLDPRELAQNWRDYVVMRCRQAGTQLSLEDVAALDTWILSGFPEGQ